MADVGQESKFRVLETVKGAGIESGKGFDGYAGIPIFVPGFIDNAHTARADASEHFKSGVDAQRGLREGSQRVNP